MKHKFSFKSLVMAFITMGLVLTTFTSCDNNDDEINDLKGKVDKLTTSLNSLKATVDGGNYVKNVTATDGGILVTFKDGKTSKVTVDGKAPTITVDKDGNLLVDGKSVGNVKGKDGKDGADPKITVEDGELKVNGKSLDPKVVLPTTANAAYIVEKDGKVELNVWNKKEGKYQQVSLSTGAVGLTSLVYFPEAYINGVEAIVFEPVVFRTSKVVPHDDCNPAGEVGCLDKIGNVVKIGNVNYQMLSAATTVAYNMNSSDIDESKINKDKLEVTSHIAKMYSKRGGVEDGKNGNPYKAKFVSMKDGKLNVTLDVDYNVFAKVYGSKIDLDSYFAGTFGGDESVQGENNVVLALQVPNAEGEGVVTSDYTVAVVKPVYGIDIAKKQGNCLRFSDMIDPAPGANVPFADKDWAGVDNAKEMGDGVNRYKGESTVKPKDARIVDLVEGKTLDLHTVVKAIAGSPAFTNSDKDCRNVDITKYGFEWKFDLLDQAGKKIVYKLNTNNTDQQEFLTLDEKTGVVKARVYSQGAQGAAVDRTPIVRVRIVDPKNPTCFVSQAFIKLLVVKEAQTAPETKTIVVPAESFVVKCDSDAKHTQGLTTQQVNELIYNAVGMSKTDFHKKYKNFSQVDVDGKQLGTVWLKEDIKDGQTTYLPQWDVDACDMFAHFHDKCGKDTDSAVLTANGVFSDDAGNKIVIVFSVNASKPDAMNLVPADMYAKYWYGNSSADGYDYIEHHSQKPTSVKDDDVNNFTYTNDLNAVFVNTKVTPTKFKEMDYVYEFAPVAEQFVGATDENGVAYNITVDNSGTVKKLFANGTLVAKIDPHTKRNVGNPDSRDMLTYEKNDVANYLLNKSVKGQNYYMWAKINIKAKCKCANAPEAYIKVDGKDGFIVRFLRPIDVNPVSTESYIDGVDLGKKGSIIDIYKATGLSDWHKDLFKDNANYYRFYNIKSVKYEGNARWDANGAVEPVPPTVKLYWADKAEVERLTGKTYTDPTYMHGGIVYNNNGSTVKHDYYLYIPITIEYERGVIVTSEVKVKVEYTDKK